MGIAASSLVPQVNCWASCVGPNVTARVGSIGSLHLQLGLELIHLALDETTGVKELRDAVPGASSRVALEGIVAKTVDSFVVKVKAAFIMKPTLIPVRYVAVDNQLVAEAFRDRRLDDRDDGIDCAAVARSIVVDLLDVGRPDGSAIDVDESCSEGATLLREGDVEGTMVVGLAILVVFLHSIKVTVDFDRFAVYGVDDLKLSSGRYKATGLEIL